MNTQESIFPPRDWQMADIWNKSLEDAPQRPMRARSNLWASELGKAPIELYLKLQGIEPTNPPNARSMRKFEAGNVFEWIVSLILKRAGILQEGQKWCSYQYPGLLEVTGKADFIVGGMPDYNKAVEDIKSLDLPDVFVRGTERIMQHFKDYYPEGLKKKPLEIKSVSAFMFDGLEKTGKAMKNHRMQAFHYLKAEKYSQGSIVYICRDDLRMLEVPLLNPGPVEDEYKNAIAEITKYIKSGEEPPKEKEILFDEDIGKFAKNWNVEYSNYLTMLYGYKDPMEFFEKVAPKVGRWNRVVARAKAGKEMTKKNEEVMQEIKDAGFDFEKCVNLTTSDEVAEVTE